MNISTITFHQLEDKHLADVKSILWIVFKKKVSIEYIKAKYNTDYVGKKNLCYIAYDGNKPVAFYGALPQLFTSGDTNFLVAFISDSFTLKEYQGKGLYYKLGLLTYELMKQHDIKMVYGFHSENTIHATKKLGWLSHYHMERFHIHINTIPLAKITRKIGLSLMYQRSISKLLKPLDSKTNMFFPSSFKHHQLYNSAFLEYKNGFYPHYYIELNGCQFLLKIDAIMQIGFFTFPTIDNLTNALESLKKLCKKLGVNEILFQVTPDSIMSEALKKFLTPQQSWLVGYFPFEDLNINDYELTFADIDTF